MSPSLIALIRCLADGQCHSGPALGRQLGISRAAVWKQLQQLPSLGLDLIASPGGGYRLVQPIDLLDAAAIRNSLQPAALQHLDSIDVVPAIDSTNSELARDPGPGGRVFLAEYQHAGRGRRGHRWVAPFAAGLCLSYSWQFEHGLSGLGGLSLAAGVAAARALEHLGVVGVGLKWPNDLLVDGHKLGGLLVDVQGESGGCCVVICGIGINVALPPEAPIDQPWTDLHRLVGWRDRNGLAAALLNEMLPAMALFAEQGMAAFLPAWNRRDLLAGRTVTVKLGDRTISGQAVGVDASGALIVDGDDGLTRTLAGGEISIGTS